MAAWRPLVQYGHTIGLLFDIAGVFLLYFFGLPPAIDPEGKVYLAMGTRIVGTDLITAVRKGRRYERWGRFALALLVIGFGLQLIASLFKK